VSYSSPQAFFTALKETLTSHAFGVGGLVAGFIIAWQLGIFQSFTWAIAVYPTVLTAEQVISALFSGRLNTRLHIGTISPAFSGNMGALRRLFQPVLAITLMTSFLMSLISMLFGSLFWRVTFADFSGILVVVLATMNLGLTLYLFALSVTFTAFKKGLDLDSVAYPIIAVVADIFITVCYTLMLYLFLDFNALGRYLVLLIALVPAIFMIYGLPRKIREEEFVRAVKASMLSLTFVALIANVTGSALQKIDVLTSSKREILTVYPALIELVSDAGLVIGSTATTKLALGLLKPSFSDIRGHLAQLSGALTASAISFVFFSISSLLLTGTFTVHTFSVFTSTLLAANVIAAIVTVLVAYALAILTFQKGLDHDHFVVPIETSIAGAATTIAFLAALLLMKPF
jgi:cation transporter-like permease